MLRARHSVYSLCHHLYLPVMSLLFELPCHLLRLFPVPAHDRKFAFPLLAVPDRPFMTQRLGHANLAKVLGNFIHRHRPSPWLTPACCAPATPPKAPPARPGP